MTEKIKTSLKIVSIFVIFIIAIITAAAFWNVMTVGVTAVGIFEIVVSVINFIIEIGFLVHYGKKYLVQ